MLCAIALLTIGGQITMQSIFDKNESWAYIINIAGRQRMLSQKIAKSAHARNLEDLQASKAEWAAVHAGLLGKYRSLEYTPNNTPEVLALYDQLQPHFESMSESADIIIENDQHGSEPLTGAA